MPTTRIATDCALPPARVLRAATPSKRGSRVEMVWQRSFRRNPRGLFFGTLFRIAGHPIFGHYARQVIANLEVLERNPASSSDGPPA
jgi:hypothetical protein